jgi:drug/metabolite transporter (DMT)-like permease
VAGVAASIMALTPVLIIPLTVLLRRERVSVGGVLGALVAVAGVAILFL